MKFACTVPEFPSVTVASPIDADGVLSSSVIVPVPRESELIVTGPLTTPTQVDEEVLARPLRESVPVDGDR